MDPVTIESRLVAARARRAEVLAKKGKAEQTRRPAVSRDDLPPEALVPLCDPDPIPWTRRGADPGGAGPGLRPRPSGPRAAPALKPAKAIDRPEPVPIGPTQKTGAVPLKLAGRAPPVEELRASKRQKLWPLMVATLVAGVVIGVGVTALISQGWQIVIMPPGADVARGATDGAAVPAQRDTTAPAASEIAELESPRPAVAESSVDTRHVVAPMAAVPDAVPQPANPSLPDLAALGSVPVLGPASTPPAVSVPASRPPAFTLPEPRLRPALLTLPARTVSADAPAAPLGPSLPQESVGDEATLRVAGLPHASMPASAKPAVAFATPPAPAARVANVPAIAEPAPLRPAEAESPVDVRYEFAGLVAAPGTAPEPANPALPNLAAVGPAPPHGMAGALPIVAEGRSRPWVFSSPEPMPRPVLLALLVRSVAVDAPDAWQAPGLSQQITGDEAAPRLARLPMASMPPASEPGIAFAPPPAPPAVVADAPETLSAAMTAARIALHYPPDAAARVDDASEALATAGFDAVDTRPVLLTISAPNVRFFHEADRETAAEVASILSAQFGGAEVAARNFTDFRPQPEEGLLEVWLAGDAPRAPAPPKRTVRPSSTPVSSRRATSAQASSTRASQFAAERARLEQSVEQRLRQRLQ